MSDELKNVTLNGEYKDRLFNFIFGSPENRKWTLSLYNAVNGSAYTDENEIEINTIKEVLYLGMHNDTSFLISGKMNVYEHQSSYNPNMPLRQLQYLGSLCEGYDEVPNDFILKTFLMINKSEVPTMLLTEYNEAEVMELFKEDGRKEGREVGRKEGKEEGRGRTVNQSDT